MTAVDINSIEATASEQLDKLAELVEGKPWGANLGKPRIYMRSCRGRKVYFDFPDYPTGYSENILGGDRLQVYIDDCGQPGRWYTSQKRIEIESHWRHGLALTATQCNHKDGWALAEKIMVRCGDYTASEIDDASHHLINERLPEAAELLGLAG